MAKGKFKHKPTGQRTFSTPEEIGTYAAAMHLAVWFQAEKDVYDRRGELEEDEESEDFAKPKYKGTAGLIEIENPNLVKPKNIKAKDIDVSGILDDFLLLMEELEKQQSHERYMKLQEQGKTEKAKKDLERLTLIRQQRAEAAKKREEEKAGMSLLLSPEQACWPSYLVWRLKYSGLDICKQLSVNIFYAIFRSCLSVKHLSSHQLSFILYTFDSTNRNYRNKPETQRFF
ncbi:hypothetical protein HU200_000451 [Digitaria exilis]|uniref:Casein kinase substrate phosphoprotein PP28 domain-containing protein n=1 Tax=Digitaria exilis TaxID=1010633 RepID=A0A835EU34_9POAL|nr:hypothetical protein HU200_026743 [Digitaria exilis]KAF8783626.1 hypothetical protein HU200_000451 [Digitaria exilis]